MMNAPDPVPSPRSSAAAGPQDASVSGARWRQVRWFAARAVALLGSLVLLAVAATAVAGWYTSRSSFCRSCHIMEPYYVSWQESTHKDVSCIKCHFPPGAGEKVRGKLLGLVQLTKYVTGTAGPRPSAEVPDASCLRSGCHETRLLSGRLDFKGMPFDHRPHLEETRRGKQLRCTSCHSQIVQGSHMTVTTSTCFLCHFKDGRFNEGLGTCTRCHQIPDKPIDLGGGVTFPNHDLAYERGVDCTYCHGDLIRGKGEVPVERCGVCHNRESDLKHINDHALMHRVHVTDHKVDCLNCHLEIKHKVDKDRLLHAANDCAACHPNHHQEQISLLQGIGARTIHPRPSSMTAAGIACASCHRTRSTSATGTVSLKGTTETCNLCHDPAAGERLQAYHLALRGALTELENGVQRVRKALAKAELKPDRAAALATELDNLQYDLSFLRVGNDIHNIHYASVLIRTLVERITALCREFHADEPSVTLPEVTRPEQPPPAEPAPPAEKPAAAAKAEEGEKPAEAEKPKETPKEGELRKEAEAPKDTPQPPDAERPAEAPQEGEMPKEPEPPKETPIPSDAEKPTAGEKPAEAEKPAAPEKPHETEKPPDAEKPPHEEPAAKAE